MYVMHESKCLAPDNTAYKCWSCQSGFGKLMCKLCQNLLLPAMGAQLTFFGQADGWMAGAAPHKIG